MGRCIFAAVLLPLGCLMLLACGSGAGEMGLTITEAWSRQPAAGQSVGVVYGVVTNETGEDVRITAASSNLTDRVELHETLMDDNGAMSMQEVPEGFIVPAGGSFSFEPGGPHIMLLSIDPETFPTDLVEVNLDFANGENLAFDAAVRSIGGDDDMDGMEMDDSDEESSVDPNSPGAIASVRLHAVADELAAGVLEPERQQPIVSQILMVFASAPAGSPEANAYDHLENLMVQLGSSDVAAASDAASAAEAALRDLQGHSG